MVLALGSRMTWNHPFPTLLFVAAGLLLALLAAWTVRGSHRVFPQRTRYLIWSLRAVTIAGVLLILANPSVPKTDEAIVRTRLALVLDTSRSMSIGREQPRIEQAEDLIEPLFTDKRFSTDLVAYTFDERLSEIDYAAGLRPIVEGNQSLLAGSLRDLLQRETSDNLCGMVVMSDGRIHDVRELSPVLKTVRQRGLTISTATIGDDWRPLNLSLDGVSAPRAVRRGARVPVRVRIRRSGGAPVTAIVRVRDPDANVVARQEVEIADASTDIQLEFPMGANPAHFVVDLACSDQELTLVDNEYSFDLGIHDPSIRVLYIEATYRNDVSNRWDYFQHEFLEKALNEQEDIECDTLVDTNQYGDRSQIFRMVGAQAFRGTGVPRTREEFNAYDVVIVSDIKLNRFNPPDDPDQQQLEWVRDLVARRGGGFIMIGGVTSFGSGYWDRTVWEQMIPVDMTRRGDRSVPFRPVFPSEAFEHPILKLDADPDVNQQIFANHPNFLGSNFVNRAKPGATVLAYWKEQNNMPIICVQQYGRGRSMAFTPDVTADWGKLHNTAWGPNGQNNEYFKRFWVSAIRWLAEKSQRRQASTILGETDRIQCEPGDRVRVHAKFVVYVDPAEVSERRVTACLTPGSHSPVELQYAPEEQSFHGEILLPKTIEPGQFELLFASSSDAGEDVQWEDRVPIRVLQRQKEFLEPTPDPQFMSQLAEATGGRSIRTPQDLVELCESFHSEKSQQLERRLVPLWDRAGIWACLLAVLSLEWIVRRLRG